MPYSRADCSRFLLLEVPPENSVVDNLVASSSSGSIWRPSRRSASSFLTASATPSGSESHTLANAIRAAGFPSSFAQHAAQGIKEGHGAHAEEHGEAHKEVHGHGGVNQYDVAGFIFFMLLSAGVGQFVSYMYARRPQRRQLEEQPAQSPEEFSRTLTVAQSMPIEVQSLDNNILVTLAMMGVHDACAERLIREIMRVDNLQWPAAAVKMAGIDDELTKMIESHNNAFTWMMGLAIVSGIAAIPTVYHKGTVEWFNKVFVTADVPEPGEMDTIWEVGGWSWNWMEPFLGTASFSILCLQILRTIQDDIGMLPMHERIKVRCANQLADLYPQYSRSIIRSFAKTASLHREAHMDQ